MSNVPPPGTPPPSGPPPPGAPPPVEPPYTTPPPHESSNRTIMLILAYLGILALIPLLVEKDDREIQWHAKYGIVLTVAWIIVSIALMIVSGIPGIGWIFGCAVGPLLWLVILAIHIFAMVKAINGSSLRLPVVAEFADKWQ